MLFKLVMTYTYLVKPGQKKSIHNTFFYGPLSFYIGNKANNLKSFLSQICSVSKGNHYFSLLVVNKININYTLYCTKIYICRLLLKQLEAL
jgi:hypothetical protein